MRRPVSAPPRFNVYSTFRVSQKPPSTRYAGTPSGPASGRSRGNSKCGIRNAQLLYEVYSVLFPRQQQRYSLFGLRHLFIANMKAVYKRAEVAALMGHISADEAVEHYGKRRRA